MSSRRLTVRPGPPSSPRRVPWCTLALAGAAALATFLPGAPEALQYDRTRVAAGEATRLLTASLTHWSARMAAFDLLVVVVAGAWVERRSRATFAGAAVLGLAATALAVHVLSPAVAVYRGSSGLATALFVVAAAAALREARSSVARAAAIAALALVALKVALEARGLPAVFAGPMPDGVAVVPAVHVAGLVAGVLAAWGFVAVPTAAAGARGR